MGSSKDDAAAATGQAVGAAVRIANSTLSNLRTQMIIANEFVDLADSPYGFPGDKWPKALAETYSDASLLDGPPDQADKMDWHIVV